MEKNVKNEVLKKEKRNNFPLSISKSYRPKVLVLDESLTFLFHLSLFLENEFNLLLVSTPYKALTVLKKEMETAKNNPTYQRIDIVLLSLTFYKNILNDKDCLEIVNMFKEINKLVIYDELFDKEGNSKFVELFSADNIFIDFIYMSNYIKVVIDNFNYSYLENIDYKDFNYDSNLHKNVEAIFTKEYLAFLNELKIRLRLKLIVKEIIKTSDLEINNVKKSVKVNNKKTKFTPIQFKILFLLASNPNRVFSAHEIYDRL